MKRAIVTGASSGIGRSLAIELGEAGFAVALVGRRKDRLEETLAALPKEVRSHALLVPADLSLKKDTDKIVSHCTSEWGTKQLDMLINCAGYGVTGRVQDIPTAEFERCWRVNYGAPVSLIKQALPTMTAARSGMIVNVTSGVGSRALPFVSPYSSAKAALNSFTDSLRVELAGTGIRVLLFSPGPVASEFQESKLHFGETELAFPPFHGEKPDKIAHRLFQALFKRKPRVSIGARAALARHLNYWSPELTDKLVEKLYRIRSSDAL